MLPLTALQAGQVAETSVTSSDLDSEILTMFSDTCIGLSDFDGLTARAQQQGWQRWTEGARIDDESDVFDPIKMALRDERSDGLWRDLGGRRVYLRVNESWGAVSCAMRVPFVRRSIPLQTLSSWMGRTPSDGNNASYAWRIDNGDVRRSVRVGFGSQNMAPMGTGGMKLETSTWALSDKERRVKNPAIVREAVLDDEGSRNPVANFAGYCFGGGLALPSKISKKAKLEAVDPGLLALVRAASDQQPADFSAAGVIWHVASSMEHFVFLPPEDLTEKNPAFALVAGNGIEDARLRVEGVASQAEVGTVDFDARLTGSDYRWEDKTVKRRLRMKFAGGWTALVCEKA